MLRADQAPLGATGRSINDLGLQFEPMHAMLWDIVHGQWGGSGEFNWRSGLGVAVIPDYATYLASPWALLVAAFPRDQVPTALVMITAVKLALAGLAMCCYLRARVPHAERMILGLLAASYATCGWALDDASYGPMWLDGLIGLPLIALAGHWALHRRHLLLAPLIVALVWWSNFYTAWMATLGAGLLIGAQVLASTSTVRSGVAAVGRMTRHTALGVLLTGALLVPTMLAVRNAQPAGTSRPLTWTLSDALVRILPQTEGVGATPSLFVGSAVTILALSLPFLREVDRRARIAQGVVLLAGVASMLWRPTIIVWHGFDEPQGSPFRAAFVACGLLVVTAGMAVGGLRRLRPDPALWLGALGLVLIAVWGRDSPWVGPWSLRLLAVSIAALGLWFTLAWLHRSTPSRLPPWVVLCAGIVPVLGLGVIEHVATAARVAVVRDARFAPVPAAWGPKDDGLLALTHDANGTAGRTVTGSENPNASMLYGYVGTAYYSSLMPEQAARALVLLGHRFEGFGRRIYESSDPGVLSIEGVRRVLADPGGGVESDEAPSRWAVLPGADRLAALRAAESPAEAQTALLGREAITVPSVTMDAGSGKLPYPVDGLTTDSEATVVLTATCPAQTIVRAWLPDQGGTLVSPAGQVPLLARSQSPGDQKYARNGLVVVSPAGSTEDGAGPAVVSIEVRPVGGVALPPAPLSCASARPAPGSLASEGAPAMTTDGSGFDLRWARPVTGEVLVTTSAQPGWTCNDGRRELARGEAAGLLTVTADGSSRVRCDYRTPGLRVGMILSVASALAIMAFAWQGRRRDSLAHRSPGQA